MAHMAPHIDNDTKRYCDTMRCEMRFQIPVRATICNNQTYKVLN